MLCMFTQILYYVFQINNPVFLKEFKKSERRKSHFKRPQISRSILFNVDECSQKTLYSKCNNLIVKILNFLNIKQINQNIE